MALDASKFTDDQKFQLFNSCIIAAGSLASSYSVGGKPLDAKQFETAYDVALAAITKSVERHIAICSVS